MQKKGLGFATFLKRSPVAAAPSSPHGGAGWYRVRMTKEPAASESAPLSLTASDGTGLRIVSFSARGVVEEPLAFTELLLTFDNPEDRVLEGHFDITLPPGATISRFAMRQPSGWQEGEVVELQAARRAYEDFLHRRQDPALLEKQPGNHFRARVFPIPPVGRKELLVSYSQERPSAAEPYRIHLRGLPQLENLDIRVIVSACEAAPQEAAPTGTLVGTALTQRTVKLSRSAVTPDADFEVAVPRAAGGQVGLRHENLVVARVLPAAQTQPDALSDLLILLDTSCSRSLGFLAQVDQLAALLAALGEQSPELPLRLCCFDQEVVEVFRGPLKSLTAEPLQRVRQRGALGASDLGRALAAAADPAAPRHTRILLISDGIVTAGATQGHELRAAAQRLGAAGIERLDALVCGGIRDEALLRELAASGLPRTGVVIQGTLPPADILRRLMTASLSGVRVSVPGSQWVWPTQLDGLQSGDEALIYADLPAERPFSVELGGVPAAAVALGTAERPLLERAWVNARIRKLLHQRDTLGQDDPDLRDALRRQIIELSTRYRVLSDFTALLVLETEADYARFGIDRRALSDILTVGPTGIELLHRKTAAVAPPVARPEPVVPKPALPAKSRRSDSTDPGANEMLFSLRALEVDAESGQGESFADEEVARSEPPDRASAPGPGRPAVGESLQAAPMPRSPAPVPGLAEPVAAAAPPTEAAPSLWNRVSQRLRGGGREPGESPPRPAPPASSAPPPSASRNASAPRPQETATSVRAQSPAAQAEPAAAALPYQGPLLEVMRLLRDKNPQQALAAAQRFWQEHPGDVLALIALGEALEALGQLAEAARVYGSIVDLFPGRADLRRFAGERLDRLGAAGLQLAVDTYRKAREQRPDHPASHRLLGFALLRADAPAEAFTVLAEGAGRTYPPERFPGIPRILQEDVGLIAAAWLRRAPEREAEIRTRVRAAGASLPTEPSLRFVLNWETDANDVDFHIHDGQGGHAYYRSRTLASGGELYADVTTGYGPECFTIPGTPKAYPYRLQAHYYSRGPMGYGMGKLEILQHDGRGTLRFAQRPFVIMEDRAFVDLGEVAAPLVD